MTTIAEARLQYWRDNSFGDDGGYNKVWEVIKVGPIPFPIRNVDGRKQALRFHDIHHLVTGYKTDLRGEGQIVAWEIAVGCGDKWFAWLINFQGLLIGLLHPKVCLQAFARGRRSKGLYQRQWDPAVLDMTVPTLRAELGLDAAEVAPTTTDKALWAMWMAVSIVGQLGGVAVGLGIVAWGLMQL